MLALFRLSAECKNLLHQVPRAFRSRDDLLHVSFWPLNAIDFIEGKLRIADNNRKHVVEIMRYPACKGADSLQLLGLPKLRFEACLFFFRLLLLSDILYNGRLCHA